MARPWLCWTPGSRSWWRPAGGARAWPTSWPRPACPTTPSTVFFASKDALVEAIVERGARTVVGYVRYRMARAAEDGPEARLRAGIEAALRQASDENLALQARAVLANATGHAPRAAHVTVALVDALAALFAQPAAELGAGDPMRAARTAAGGVVAALQYWLFTEEAPGRAETEHLVGFLLAGVRAPTPVAGRSDGYT
ncbi:hypothetical protein [Streptomyces sp. ME18-1-4]|uniref:hypothetical protein n=1 Tax=Streptomyces sp. ME18-1-4 TaxID=3028685 RepID=UPI0029A1DD19|nr:hypothetical protein [Streptomyces sp. ME18-1-4]MDX3246235.1 hypothetical protein [Streptomyces sp. ME18-1-4]